MAWRRRGIHPPSQRPLPGAANIDVDWTLEAAADPRSVVHDPTTPTTPETRRADDDALAAEVRRVRDEYADEEAEAAEREAADNAATLDGSLSLRISRDLDDALERRSAEEQISPSALARRLLRQALQADNQPVLTTRQVEEIARRIMRESA